MGVIGKCCCLTALLSKLLCIACTFGPLIFTYLLYVFYIKPWGEKQVQELTRGNNLTSPSVNCSGCVVGVNTQFPTTTTGILHFMDTSGGKASSAAVGISLFATIAAVLAGTAVSGSVAQLGSSASMGAGVYEMMAIVEQAQFVGLLGQLATGGVPTFFQQFTKDLAWVNFNVAKLANTDPAPRRQLLNLLEAQHQQTGVERYATMVGVLPEDLFYYTLVALGVVLGAVLALYVVVVLIMSCCRKSSKESLWVTYFRKVIWAYVLILLLALYILSMTGSYRAYDAFQKSSGTGAGSMAIVILLAIIGTTLVNGILVIASNSSELHDVGTYEHEQRPFNAKYGPYYEEFNVDNRYFFVPKALLAITTGVIVGVVQSPMWQLGLLVGANLVFLLALVVREPFLLRFLFYIGVLSSFFKTFLLILMVIMVRDDVFPQKVRDNVAYVIVGVNLAVFALLVIRQLYVAGRKILLSCGAKKKDSSRDRANFDQHERESPVHTPMNRQPQEANFTNDLERCQPPPSRQAMREPLNAQANSSSDAALATYHTDVAPLSNRDMPLPRVSAGAAHQDIGTLPPARSSFNFRASEAIPTSAVRTTTATSPLTVLPPPPKPYSWQPPPQSPQAISAAAKFSVSGGAATMASPRVHDDNEYDLDREIHGQDDPVPPMAVLDSLKSGDSYGSTQSFGSYGSNFQSQSSDFSDSSSVGGAAAIAYLRRKSSYENYVSQQPGGSIPFVQPRQGGQPRFHQGSSSHESFSSSFHGGDSMTSRSPTTDSRRSNTLLDSFQSYQSAHFSDGSSIDRFQANDSFRSNGLGMASEGSAVLDTLAAKYLAELSHNENAVATPDNATPISPSSVPKLDRRATTARQRSHSMDEAWERAIATDPPAQPTSLASRHSESSLVPYNLTGDGVKRQSVYLRYIANDQTHSFLESEDEIDL
ncbi:hypothetical protein DYB32_004161 [Aphanomyces invadans]|uniref:TRP C-terminal domain-containing protein n=1 Tax=Aphanomyces invadans TaxID=157072 RepID=A0A3R6VMT5_9STRA|nr:hypothetical protein DYB32_004161 [Aphanomyces invadans]